ncbi:energy transducer TonB [candidate division KSB1 bacterium]|nr:energy transducer TonB [candidate division KSB1 bacterium]
MRTNNIRKITIAVSIILHLLFLVSYKSLRDLIIFSPDLSLAKQEDEKRIVFEFDKPKEVIETPDDAIQQVPNEPTNLLSDKNSIARDRYTANDKPEGAPYQHGDLDVNNIYEQRDLATTQESSPMQQQNPNQRQQQEQQQKKQSTTEKSRYALNDGPPPEFSRQVLLGKEAQRQEQNMALHNNEDFDAREVGGLSFNTYAWEWGPYMLQMKRKIQQNIFPPPAFTHMGMIGGEVFVRFKVMPNGEVKDLKVLKYTGHESLIETSVKAIENSALFNPLPADFPENFLEVTASFGYHIQR